MVSFVDFYHSEDDISPDGNSCRSVEKVKDVHSYIDVLNSIGFDSGVVC